MAFWFDDQLPEHMRSAAAPCDTLILEMICKRFGHRYEGHVPVIAKHLPDARVYMAPPGTEMDLELPEWKDIGASEVKLMSMRCIGRCQLCGVGIMTDGS